MKKIKIILGSGTIAAMLLPLTALALTPILFGGATIVGEDVSLVSDLSDLDASNDFSGVRVVLPDGTTLASMTSLALDFNVTDDDCFGGSPRIQLAMDTDNDGLSNGNIFVYLGPVPAFSGCAAGWQSSGNLIGSVETRYDLTQFGGPFYGTYANAIALLGTAEVLRVTPVVDSGWGFADLEQTILIDNLDVNGEIFEFTPPPTSKDQCKDGGWMDFSSPAFKNQGDCVSFVASEGKANGNP